jgi:hypothetical protein
MTMEGVTKEVLEEGDGVTRARAGDVALVTLRAQMLVGEEPFALYLDAQEVHVTAEGEGGGGQLKGVLCPGACVPAQCAVRGALAEGAPREDECGVRCIGGGVCVQGPWTPSDR